MNERKESVQKLLSVLISLTLLLGFLGPASDALVGSGNGDDIAADSDGTADIKSMELQSDDLSSITTDEYVNDTERPVDKNIVIKDGGHLHVNNSTLILSIDEDHTWNITVKNGGQLSLWNSTIKTSTEETSSLRPFLKTDITATGDSTLSLRNNSAFKFPGFVNLDNSELVMKNSRFDKLNESEIPDYDYLWDDSIADSIQVDDNDDAPRLIVKNGSSVYMEESKINNYYSYGENNFPERNGVSCKEMTWYPLNSTTGEVITELKSNSQLRELSGGNTLDLEEWYLDNPMVQHKHLDDYPYIDPINKISSLYVEITYSTQENYTGEGNITYYSPEKGEHVEALSLDNSSTSKEKATDIWEIELSEFNKTVRNNVTRLLQNVDLNVNNPGTGDNTSLEINELKLLSSYDNDVHVEDSTLTAINSYIDVDYKTSDIDPRTDNDTATDPTTYLQDSSMQHNVLRIRNSSYKSYGLNVSDEEPDENTAYGDPWILNTPTSENQTWIYRWVELQIRNQNGVPLPGATVDPNHNSLGDDQTLSDRVGEINSLYNNTEAWDYMNRTAEGHYDSENDTFVADGEGKVSFFIASDRINYPDDWSNSKFVGNYELNITYKDDSQNIWVNDTEQLDLPDTFPEMNNPHKYDLNFDVDLPDLKAEDQKFTVGGEGTGYVPRDTSGKLELNVSNVGDREAYDVNVSFYMNEVKQENFIDSKVLSRLNVSESQNVNISWTADEVGDYKFIGVVDPDDDILEIDENNNRANTTLTVGEKPELSVQDISAEPQFDVMNTTQVDLTATISNDGGTDVSDVTVSFYQNHTTDQTRELIQNVTLDVAGNGSTVGTGPVTWDTSDIEVGDYEITVEVDPEGNIDELDETNNEMTTPASVLTKPDLTPTDFTVTPDPVRINETVTISVKVENLGEWTSDEVTVEFYVDGTIFNTEILPALEGGQTSQEITVEWAADMTQSGKNETRVISVMVQEDPNEGDTTNQEVSQDILVERYLDLSVTDLSVDSSEVPEGKNVVVSGDVSNTGDLDVANFTAQLLVDGEIAMENTGYELDSGESMPIIFDWGPALSSENLTSEDRELTLNLVDSAEIDNGQEFNDQTPGDNSMDVSVMVYEAPDLTLMDLQIEPGPVRINQDVNVSVKVANRGNWPSQQVTVHFSVDDEAPFSTVTLPELEGGETSQEINAQWTADITSENETQDRNINVWVEPDPYEGNYNNLTTSSDITVQRQIELSINEVQVTPEEVTAGEDVQIDTTIENVGDLQMDQFQVELYIDDQIEQSDVIESLAVDESTEVTFTWEAEVSQEDIMQEDRTVKIAAGDQESLGSVMVNSEPDLEFVSKTWYREGEMIDFSGDVELTEMDSLRFEGQLKNTGGTPISGAVLEYLFPDGTKGSRTINASSGEAVNVSMEWTVEVVSSDIKVWVNSTQDPQTATTYDQIIVEDITTTPLTPVLTDRNVPDDLQPGEEYVFSGTVVRDKDGKAVAGKDVVVTIKDEDGQVLGTASGTTDDEGYFTVTLRMPSEGGNYNIAYETRTAQAEEDSYSLNVESEVQGVMGIPWWVIVLIVAAPAGGVGSFIIYREFFGEREMVECGNCGATISADATSCPKCGVEFDTETVKCSECDEWIPADSDVCPECGAEFIKTGKEIEDYTERMRKQFRKFVKQQKRKAEEELGRELSKKEFMDWWKDRPSFVTFEDWVKRKEKQRREGSKECPECGTLNSVDDAVCQKCGASLIELGKPPEEETSEKDFEEELSEEVTEDLEGISEIGSEEEEIEEEAAEPEPFEPEETEPKEETEEPEEEEEAPKKKKKKVKKKVVKKPPEEDEEE